jgi:TIR domain
MCAYECRLARMVHDAFICHASEDKEAFVRPLAEALERRHIDIWYDEFSLRVGDGLRAAIDRGLAGSRFGIVVLSPAFFAKPWTQWELDGLVTRQLAEERSLILPVWHDIGAGEIRAHSPSLANVRAVRSSIGIDLVCSELLRTIRPVESPLLAAQQELMRFGWQAPPISDEWWLDMVEAHEQLESGTYPRHWWFPAPEGFGVQGARRGRNIAWAAFQLDWQYDAEQNLICQTTRPDEVWAFLDRNPALLEACHRHPDLLANYVPQLLIPAFSGDFSEMFDELLATSERECRDRPIELRPKDKLCARRLSLRHPTFGDNELSEVADKWMNGLGGDRSAKLHSYIDYLFWLLARDSEWLPRKHHEALLSGMRSWAIWDMDLEPKLAPELWEGMYSKRRRTAGWTRKVQAELAVWASATVKRLDLQDEPAQIADRFIQADIVGGFDERRLARLRHRARWRLTRTKGENPRKGDSGK